MAARSRDFSQDGKKETSNDKRIRKKLCRKISRKKYSETILVTKDLSQIQLTITLILTMNQMTLTLFSTMN